MSTQVQDEVQLSAEIILEECETALEANPPFECRAAIGRIRRQAQAMVTAVLRSELVDPAPVGGTTQENQVARA